MNAHLSWESINEYVDGVLPAAERLDADRHLERCDECSVQLSELRDVLGSARSAPGAIEAPNDVWPVLRAELERRKVVGIGVGGTSDEGGVGDETVRSPARGASLFAISRRSRWGLAAAAIMLVTVSSAITAIIVRGNDAARIATQPNASRATSPGPNAVEVAQVERGYLDSVVELTQALDAARPRLAPRTIAIVERNLAVIDAAIAESRAALLRDPGNRELLDVLAGTYRQKLDLLRRAAQLASS